MCFDVCKYKMYFAGKNKGLKKKLDKELSKKDKANSRLKNHNQSFIAQIMKLKNEKKSQQEKLEQLTSYESLIDKVTMTDPIKLGKTLDMKT